MYSVVLLAAMTTATETPDCHFGCRSTCYGGCYGSCSGSCYGSCYGSCSGCYGGGFSSSCGCCGGGYGCYGGGYGGCYGGCGYSSYPVVSPPVGGGVKPEGIEKPKDDKKESLLPGKAKLIVEVPADAKLYIDDQLMKSTTSVRKFSTPELQSGQTYYYMVRVEMPSEGTPQSVTRRILIRAGEEVTADFKDMNAPAVATARK
jgi:uncharacterized protein (TIGR03000 family)